jgi:uncharacterized protein (TIGR02597 family)
MKTHIPYSLILAAAVSGMASGAETAYTTPVGYVSLGDTTVGQPALKANTDSYITLPLYRASEYTGTVGGVAGNVVTLSGTPGFTVNQYVSSTTPYEILVEGGPSSGLIGIISANTINSVTVTLQPGESLASVVAANKITIRKAWTLQSIFAGNTIPVGAQVNLYGNLSGVNTPADAIYEFDGTDWFNTDSFDSANNVVVYSGEGIRLRSPATAPIAKLVISGEVGMAQARILLDKLVAPKAQDNLIGYVSPVDQKLNATGLGTTTGDQIIAWNNATAGINKAPTTILEFDGVDWFDTDSFETVTATYSLKAGQGYKYRRTQASPVGTVAITSTPSYVP